MVEEQVQQDGGHTGNYDSIVENDLKFSRQVLKDVGVHGDPKAQANRDGCRQQVGIVGEINLMQDLNPLDADHAKHHDHCTT